MAAISSIDFDFISDLAYRSAAIVLERGKEYLVEARLTPLAHREGFGSLTAFIAHLKSQGLAGPFHAKAVDALTTNETYFFRDFHPFEALRQTILPNLIARRQAARTLTIWCAAASTGQEPFSVAMLLREHFSTQLAGWKIDLLASDFSPTVLAQAAAGRYNQIEVNRGLPAPYLLKYFTKQGDAWFIREEIRQMVQFRRMNLVEPWPILPPCDLVLIRNAMIYFDLATKRSILRRIRNCLLPHGVLLLGSAETTINVDAAWTPVSHGRAVAYHPDAAAGPAASAPPALIPAA